MITGGLDGPLAEQPPDPPAAPTLAAYERVTPELLARVEQTFTIERYEAHGWNYTLIVSRRERPSERYKATRNALYRAGSAGWQRIGPYLHW